GLMGRPPEPGQHGLFCHAEHKADASEINTDEKHFEGHHDLFFRGAEIEKDCLACLRKVGRTRMATKDTSLAALREIGGDSAHVALLLSSIMRTLGIGAWLAPLFGFPHRSILRGVRCGNLTLSGGLAFCYFQSTNG